LHFVIECDTRGYRRNSCPWKAQHVTDSEVSILHVEDFEPFRAAVFSILKTRPELRVVAEASDGLEALRMLRQFQPDVVLLDIGLPKLNGIDVARQILEIRPETKIIFVTQENSDCVVQEAMRLGASGYVNKTSAWSKLLEAIDKALRAESSVAGPSTATKKASENKQS